VNQQQKMPLEGIRVVDFSWVQAGPWVGRYLANYGAEVIKVESATRVDWARNFPPGPKTVDGKVFAGGLFINVNCDKLSITLNLKTAKGVEVAKKLVAKSDIVYANFSTGVMDKYGLGYQELRKVKPDIIMLEMPVFGITGPYATFSGYGPGIQAEMGLTAVTGFEGRPSGTGINTAIPDMGPNPTHATVALLAALHYKRRTGKGQFIEEAQFESSLNWMETYVLEYSANKRLQPRRGNSHMHAAPHGVYRCEGDDRWCVIAVFTEAAWKCFCEVVNAPWTSDEKFATFAKRKEHEDELNRRVEEWTQERSPEEAMRLMQQAGVISAVVETTGDLLDADEQVKWNNAYMTLNHPDGECLVENARIGFSKTPGKIRRPGPSIGEDNEYVFKEILGMAEEEINQCYVEGIFD
jgi:benzylsuccinate CoA-transferase BbsF subunit